MGPTDRRAAVWAGPAGLAFAWAGANGGIAVAFGSAVNATLANVTVCARVIGIAHTLATNAHAMRKAGFIALLQFALLPMPPMLAHTLAIDALAISIAIAGAGLN